MPSFSLAGGGNSQAMPSGTASSQPPQTKLTAAEIQAILVHIFFFPNSASNLPFYLGFISHPLLPNPHQTLICRHNRVCEIGEKESDMDVIVGNGYGSVLGMGTVTLIQSL